MFKPVSFLGKLFKAYLLSPSHPSKIRIENCLGKWFFSSGIKVRNSEGVIFKLDANDWITRTMIEEGNYEPESVKLGQELLKNGGVFIDIGANFGLYSCQIGCNKAGVDIYAIEPNYLILGKLVTNISLNQLENNITIINAAITDKFQMVFLQLPSKNNIGSTFASLTNSGGISSMSCSLEYLITTNSIQEIELLKIDIEGNEFDVVENFPFDKYLIKNIILEFNHLSKITFQSMKTFFEQKGFNLFTINRKMIIDGYQVFPENNIWLSNTRTNIETNQFKLS